jgi:uncharacterized membrane protein YbhN (UPF0104 family)
MTAHHSKSRRTLLLVLKMALAAAILLYLLFQARDGFARLSEKSIVWPLLAVALVCTMATAALNFVRWHLLIRAQEISVRLIDTLRLGALGFALNYASLGAVGGDFFKAIFLAHGQPGKRTEAVATVVADRVMGLLTMLAVASCGILVAGLLDTGSPTVRVLCKTILVSAGVAWSGAVLLVNFGGLSGSWMCGQAARIPLVGKTLARLLRTVHVYRSRKGVLVVALAISVVMAMGFVTSFYLVARALPIHEPPWSQHLVIVPTAALVGAIPLTPSGVGTTELALEELYKAMPGGNQVVAGDGTLVGIGRRATEIAVALVGLVFYLTHRREVEEVYHEAEVASELAEAE